MKLRVIDGLDVRGKYVLLRDDFNVQIVDGEIGVFHREGRCMKKLRQSGEYLSIADEQILSQGIPVNDEKELIIVLESYHLQ